MNITLIILGIIAAIIAYIVLPAIVLIKKDI